MAETLAARDTPGDGVPFFDILHPEPTIPEDIFGAVITALNEEAVASAALANKGGINLIHTYEALGAKMHGVLRQEVIFTNHCQEAGRRQGWLSIPLVLTSRTWENAKNELSHQTHRWPRRCWGSGRMCCA